MQARPGSAEAPAEILLSYVGYPYFAEDLQLATLRALAALSQAAACHSQPLRTPFIALFPAASGSPASAGT